MLKTPSRLSRRPSPAVVVASAALFTSRGGAYTTCAKLS
jgi:hypothetical protein